MTKKDQFKLQTLSVIVFYQVVYLIALVTVLSIYIYYSFIRNEDDIIGIGAILILVLSIGNYYIYRLDTSLYYIEKTFVINRHFLMWHNSETIPINQISNTKKGILGLYITLISRKNIGPIVFLDDDTNVFDTDYEHQPVNRTKQVLENLKQFIDKNIKNR